MFKDQDSLEGQPVAEIYARGQKQMHGVNWSGAATTYKRLVAQYPYGPYTEQALMETAYAHYKSGNNEEAISSIDRFIDRQSVVEGKSVSVRVDLGGRRIIKTTRITIRNTTLTYKPHHILHVRIK